MEEKRFETLKWFAASVFFLYAVVCFFYREWEYLLVCVIMLVLALSQEKIVARQKISFSENLNLIILLFVFLSIVLGETREFYVKFWWWDVLLHSFSAVVLGLVGFAIVFAMNAKAQKNVLSPGFIAVFGFTFAVCLGAVWEIFEFFMDLAWGLNMQKSGLVDTMTDLIVDVIGAAVASSWGYLALKGDFRKTYDFFKGMIVSR